MFNVRIVMFNYLKFVNRFKRKTTCIFYTICFNRYISVPSVKPAVPPWKIIFYGTDQISEASLKALNTNQISNDDVKVVQSLEVVCIQSDCPVRRYATLNNLTIHTWPFDVPLNLYDIGIVVSFGHMIPSSSIQACKFGMINAHPSLLPRWRGAAPIFHTILSGDKKTGVTITQVSPNKFDVGGILMQEEYLVPEHYTTKLLIKDLSKLAADLVLKTLRNLPYYIESSHPQLSEGKTLARKIKPEKCCIDWVKDSSICIDRKFRAFDGFFDFFTTWKGILKVHILDIASPQEIKDAKVSDLVEEPVSPGFCYFHKRRKIIFVKCQDGWTGIKSLRIPKKGKITALDFYNGFITKEDPGKCYFV